MNYLSKRQDILNKRAERLDDAIVYASSRWFEKEVSSTCVTDEVIFTLSPLRTDSKVAAIATVEYKYDTVESVSLSWIFYDVFYRLRLIPSRTTLVLYVHSTEDPEIYVSIDAATMVRMYSGREIQRLVKMLYSL